MSLLNPLDHHNQPKTQQEVEYDIFADYFGTDQSEPDSDWCWYTWYFEYDYDVFTTWFEIEEVFEFFDEEVDCPNIPEPSGISLVLLGCIITLMIKRRINI
tara:strand:+ start:32 stop:334 length:303 start_codon:yes stop_codon:yes gene_type:complete